MKVEIILAIVWMTLCVCERQQRSTVLTDESKRVLEQFDFSNFDKQEALNYIDRQRYENQIRGKRSHSKLKRNHDGKKEKILDVDTEQSNSPNENKRQEVKSHLNSEKFKKSDSNGMLNNLCTSESTVRSGTCRTAPTIATQARSKRGHNSKKKNGKKKEKFTIKLGKKGNDVKKGRKKKTRKKRKRHYWDHWSDWSNCSVTCGRGRKIRWRKCIARNCVTGELEMGEKACQLPACNLLTKLLGL